LAKARSLMQEAPPREGDPGPVQPPAPDGPVPYV